MTDKLKPCKCGNEAMCGPSCTVYCKRCGMQTAEHESMEMAIAVWNNRPVEDELIELLKYARCPNTDCINGTIPDYDKYGEVTAVQCQWCYEVKQALVRAGV